MKWFELNCISLCLYAAILSVFQKTTIKNCHKVYINIDLILNRFNHVRWSVCVMSVVNILLATKTMLSTSKLAETLEFVSQNNIEDEPNRLCDAPKVSRKLQTDLFLKVKKNWFFSYHSQTTPHKTAKCCTYRT